MQTLRPHLPYFVLLVVSLGLLFWLFPITHPYGGIHLPFDDRQIIEHSRSILADMGIENADLTSQIQLEINRPLLKQAQQSFGLDRSNQLMRDSIPVYFWNVRWMKRQNFSLGFNGGGSSAQQAESVADLLRGEINFEFDTRANVLNFSRKLSDSTKLPSLSQEQAKNLASSFLKKYATIRSINVDTGSITLQKSIDQPFRKDYEFVWTGISPVLKNPVKETVRIAGNVIARFETTADVPSQFAADDSNSVYQILIVLLYIAIGISMVIIAFKRFRSYEIGFRLAVILGILIGVLTDVEIFLGLRGEMSWEILIPLLFAPLFTGGAFILVWAVCESVVRESWKQKFVSLDLLSKGHFFHSRIGSSIIRGMSLGTAGIALWLVCVKVANSFMTLWITRSSNDAVLHTFDLSISWLYVVAHGVYANLYVYAFCVLFTVSFLRKYISSGILLVAVSSLFLGIMDSAHLHPLAAEIIVSSITSAVAIWTFYRFDALAAFLTMLVMTIGRETAGLFVVGNTSYAFSGFMIAGMMLVVMIVSVAMTYRKNEVTDFDEIVPAFARHISERQRLQQELEIARSVQMSFLPKANPVTSKLDIASRCAPALEVGGDYYDFIDLGDKKLGVAVGDVSGKGTQAAFFMTLTKGFLNALARVSDSPSKVLTQVNKLFYENVERGMFISMVYGIFDTRRNSLTLARAGHNPVIMCKSQAHNVQVVNPKGLALGLDQGNTFAKSIQEVTIKFRSNDLFVFYTDGFPEAMNKTMEEFGEERLCRTVEKYSHQSAAEIMDGVFKEMKLFTGKARQHDDMTIVVVKIV